MVKRATKKERGKATRKRRKVIIIAVEGKNRTERNYFNEFNRDQKEYKILFAKGNETDPVGIVRNAINSSASEELDYKSGDLCFCVFDTDFQKEDQLRKAASLANKNGIRVLLSNPCVEVWFLLHYRYSNKGYQSNSEVLDELKSYEASYSKNMSSFVWLRDKTGTGLTNAAKLERYAIQTEGNFDVIHQNSSTELHYLVGLLQDCVTSL